MNVRIFSMPNCTYCSELKDRLKEMEIPFDDIDVSLDENEKEFDKVMEVGDTESVPCIVVGGKHLLVPDVNFYTIKDAADLIKHIIDNES